MRGCGNFDFGAPYIGFYRTFQLYLNIHQSLISVRHSFIINTLDINDLHMLKADLVNVFIYWTILECRYTSTNESS
jgi:hypothetical protein